MTHCPRCAKDVEPITALHPLHGVCSQCPTCETPFMAVDEGAQFAQPAMNKDAPATPAAAAMPVARPAPKSAAPSDALSLLDQLRARLGYCEEQIAARDGFIAERDMLRKMLAAADGETRPSETAALPLN